MERLETQYERRQVGFEHDNWAGRMVPSFKTYIIGHGQQLARQRLALVAKNHLYTGPSAVTRQQVRAQARTAAAQQASRERQQQVAARRNSKPTRSGAGA